VLRPRKLEANFTTIGTLASEIRPKTITPFVVDESLSLVSEMFTNLLGMVAGMAIEVSQPRSCRPLSEQARQSWRVAIIGIVRSLKSGCLSHLASVIFAAPCSNNRTLLITLTPIHDFLYSPEFLAQKPNSITAPNNHL